MPAPVGNQNAAKAPGEARDHHIHIRLRPLDWQLWSDVASLEGYKVGEWVRLKVTEYAQQYLKGVGHQAGWMERRRAKAAKINRPARRH